MFEKIIARALEMRSDRSDRSGGSNRSSVDDVVQTEGCCPEEDAAARKTR